MVKNLLALACFALLGGNWGVDALGVDDFGVLRRFVLGVVVAARLVRSPLIVML